MLREPDGEIRPLGPERRIIQRLGVDWAFIAIPRLDSRAPRIRLELSARIISYIASMRFSFRGFGYGG